MKIYFNILLIFFSTLLFSQKIIHPKYVFKQDFEKSQMRHVNDPYFFEYKQVAYIGKLSEKINVEYEFNVFTERNTQFLNEYYRKENFITLNNEFRERHYVNFTLYADISQETSLFKTELDTLRMSVTEANIKIDSLAAGFCIDREIPEKINFYEGFPVTIYNFEGRERVIGYGNNVALELEALDKTNKWQTVTKVLKYTCGNGIYYFVLKPGEIATVFVPRLHGNFKTRFRYRLGNVVSNEFEGSIDEKYIGKN